MKELASLIYLFEGINEKVKSEPNYIKLSNKPIVFVGDTHGDYHKTEKVLDLFRDEQLVFLGDYVDRASEPMGSLNNLVLLLEAKCSRDIILLRGNHEFARMWQYGFGWELSKYDHSLGQAVAELFSNLPYIAATDDLIALHGGLPEFKSIDELKSLPKGLRDYYENNLIFQIVFNDHSENQQEDKAEGRGDDIGFQYSKRFFKNKMKILGKNVLLRGHDYMTKGFSFDDRLLTIFTCDSYNKYGGLKGSYVARMEPGKGIRTARDLEIIYV